MVSIPSSVKKSQPQGVDITIQLSLAQQRIQHLETENRQLKQQLLWEDRLFANPHLSPSHKLALRETVYTVRKADQPQDRLTKIFIPAIAEKVGLSAKTVGKNLQYLADTGALVREAETETDQYGQKITRVYIGLTEQVKRPDQIKPTEPRNHGGHRETCPACGSENLLEEKKIICTECGTVISKTQRPVNTDPTDKQDGYRSEDDQEAQHAGAEQKTTLREEPQPTNNLTPLLKPKEPMDNLTAGEKPPAPPMACLTLAPAIIGLPMPPERIPAMTEAAQQSERDLHRAAALLLDTAGDSQEHIVMNTDPTREKKYLTVHRPLTLTDMRDHLQGKKTVGGTLAHKDGTTRALCFDTDDNPTDSVTWQQVQEAATLLIAEGYTPLLEPSPAGRGGHLWLIFSERVNASAAYTQVCTIAPALKEIAEYWPSRGNQKVRLPAGRYVTPTFSQWTTIYDADRAELSNSDLLDYQTPADLIPTDEPQEQAPGSPAQPEQSSKRQPSVSANKEPDVEHRRKYGKHAMWVEWPDEQYLIDLFNSEHTIDDLAQPERNGMINASTIGRPERTPSVGVTKDGQRFTDFGAGAKRPDGKQDGGDPFEFYIRSRNLEKAEVLRALGQELNKAASRELLRAARAGELPPLWVMEIVTDRGREVYNENATQRGHPSLEAGGAGGFSIPDGAEQPQEQAETQTLERAAIAPPLSNTGELWQPEQKTDQQTQDYAGDYPPPSRACIHCKVTAWQWTGEKYICSNPGHLPG